MKNRIRDILQQKSLTAKGLADMIGVSPVSLSNILNGKQEPSANTLNKIAESLGVPFWQLFVDPNEVLSELGKSHSDDACIHCPKCGASIAIQPKLIED